MHKTRYSNLLAYCLELHELVWIKANVPEEYKLLLVRGTLLALRCSNFNKTFSTLAPEVLGEAWLDAIKKELAKADLQQADIDRMLQTYSEVAVYLKFAKPDSELLKEYPGGVFKEIISKINKRLTDRLEQLEF